MVNAYLAYTMTCEGQALFQAQWGYGGYGYGYGYPYGFGGYRPFYPGGFGWGRRINPTTGAIEGAILGGLAGAMSGK
ncbi:unnamed protein product [Nippostrongylus brasiliensis]|uniref:Uncharacterized protein n=1 Tax=Nippostrongylus brasiliensis TaxID=27835 RepID=A0A0N4Y9D8_NIPBR|nr:unnamed protein product [Nippostrongylus brasiliensis]